LSLKAEQKQRTRAAILESAVTLIRTRGIAASSVMDVMKGAGLTVGGFYAHFDSKEALFRATIQEAGSRMWDRLLATVKGDDPGERVFSVVRGYLSRSHRDNAALGCLLPSLISELAREGGPAQQALEVEIQGFVKGIAEMLGEGAEARRRAIGLIAVMVGGLAMSRALGPGALSDDFLKASRELAARELGV
jgi:TetR/AcrR family transcriptional repressor of nem operon